MPIAAWSADGDFLAPVAIGRLAILTGRGRYSDNIGVSSVAIDDAGSSCSDAIAGMPPFEAIIIRIFDGGIKVARSKNDDAAFARWAAVIGYLCEFFSKDGM